MKYILLTVLLFTSLNIFATDFLDVKIDGETSEAIYLALDVEEVPVMAQKTILKFKKTVGALVCEKVDEVIVGISYSCTLKKSIDAPQGARCVAYEETCKATFCTGGYNLIVGGEIQQSFRFWDYGESAFVECAKIADLTD